MTLVQELRAQLERVVRDPHESWCGGGMSDEVFDLLMRTYGGNKNFPCNQWGRSVFMSMCIRRAVVTRERDGS